MVLFCKVINAVRADELAFVKSEIFGGFTEDTGGSVFLEDYTVSVHEYLERISFLNVKRVSDLDGENYSSQGVDLAHDSGCFHFVTPFNKDFSTT